MFYGGVEAYDLFYDNWILVEGEKQVKIGRLSYFEMSNGTPFTNDVDAYVPKSGRFNETFSTENSFAVYGERIVFKMKKDLKLEWSHLCDSAQYFVNLG